MFLLVLVLLVYTSIVQPLQLPSQRCTLQDTPPRLTLLLKNESLFTIFQKLLCNHEADITSIMVNSYNLTDEAFVSFLGRMHQKGVAVTVMVDQSNLKIPTGHAALEELLESGIDALVFNPYKTLVVAGKTPLANHAKFILWSRYDNTSKSVVNRFTAGSANFTSNAMRNQEHSVLGEDGLIFKELASLFAVARTSQFSCQYSTVRMQYDFEKKEFIKLQDVPKVLYTMPSSQEPLYVPLSQAASYGATTFSYSYIKTVMTICKNMKKNDELIVCVYTFDLPSFCEFLKTLSAQGVKIIIIVDKHNCLTDTNKIKTTPVTMLQDLQALGVQVFVFTGIGYSLMHAKFILISFQHASALTDICVIEGSANLTFLADKSFNQFLVHVNKPELYAEFQKKYKVLCDSKQLQGITHFVAKNAVGSAKKRLRFNVLQDDK